MLPTLRPGSLLLATERGRIRPGAVVVVERRGREIVKRVASLDRDSVRLAGDNPERSTDSRSFGTVGAADVRGVVRAVYWPPRAARLLR